MLRKNMIGEKEIKVVRNSVDPGAVEDIYELKYREPTPKSGKITENMNQINTAGATSSTPGVRE